MYCLIMLFEKITQWFNCPKPRHCPWYFITMTQLQPSSSCQGVFTGPSPNTPRSLFVNKSTTTSSATWPPFPDASTIQHLCTPVHLLKPSHTMSWASKCEADPKKKMKARSKWPIGFRNQDKHDIAVHPVVGHNYATSTGERKRGTAVTTRKFRTASLCLISESAKYDLGYLPGNIHLLGSLRNQAVWKVPSWRIITLHRNASLKGLCVHRECLSTTQHSILFFMGSERVTSQEEHICLNFNRRACQLPSFLFF